MEPQSSLASHGEEPSSFPSFAEDDPLRDSISSTDTVPEGKEETVRPQLSLQERVFPDNACPREILNLDVHCNFKTSGCLWIGPPKELEIHIKSCEYREVQCTQCGQYIQQLELVKHKEIDCPMWPELCPHYREEVPSQQMHDHINDDCSEVLHTCPNRCNSRLMKLAEVERHVAVEGGQCPLSEMGCPYRAYGCSFVSIRKNIPTHLEQYSVFHCQLQAECFVELKQQAEKNTAATQHLLERVGSLETRLNAVERLREQRVELLDDRREMHSDAGRIEVVEDQAAQVTNTVAQLQNHLDDGYLSRECTSQPLCCSQCYSTSN